MSNERYAIGIDAGYCNMGAVVAKLPKKITGGMEIVEQRIMSARLMSGADLKREGIAKSLDGLRRISEQTDNLDALFGEWSPCVIFTEIPLGSGKSSSAVKGMAFATALLGVFLRLRYPDVPCRHFSPYDLKIGIGGKANATKESIAEAVHAAWPDVEWINRTTHGRKVSSYDIEDAAATLLLAPDTDIYKAIYAGR